MKKFLATFLALAMSLSTVSVFATEDTAVELPTAQTPLLDVSEIEEVDLTYAMNFIADTVTEEQLAAYGDWYADFVFKVNKDVTFAIEGADGYLAGSYDAYADGNWIRVPVEGSVSIEANDPIKVMGKAVELMGQPELKVTYADVYTDVQDFKCGVYFTNEFLAANPDLITTLELRLYNPENEEESFIIGETHQFLETELPTATAVQLDAHDIAADEENPVDLTYVMEFSADTATEEQLLAYGDWFADFVFTINKNATFGLSGEADGYLAGSYQAYADGNWIRVPLGDASVDVVADEPVKIMETAADIMDEPGLKYRYSEVYDIVRDFKCGVKFSDEFLLENPDLETSLELRLYNPDDESESYLIGKTYSFAVKAETTEENVEVQGTKLTGNSVEIQKVDVSTIAPEEKTVTIDTNAFVSEEEEIVDTVTIPASVIADVEALGDDAALNITLANGEDDDTTVSINKDALTAIKAAVEGEGAQSLTIKVEKTEDLTTDQDDTVEDLNNTVVYKLSFVTEDGTEVYPNADASDNREITISVYYAKSGTGEIVVKHLKDDGTLEDVDYSYSNDIITMTLSHFSEYVIYQKPVSVGGMGGGAVSVTYCTVNFDTDGGSAVESQKIVKNTKLTEPAAPTKEGYTFDGWYKDKNYVDKYDFLSYVTSSFTLYAKWVANEDKTEDKPDTDKDVESTLTFGDVAENAWYYEDVKYANENGLMNGVSATEFAPAGLVTRAMLVTILYRNEGEPAVNRSIPFADIDLGAYYANAVIWAQQNGIVNGYSDTEFAPDANITREQIAAIILRYAQYKGYDVSIGEDIQLADFDDFGAVHEYAIPAVKYAIGMKIINGKTDRTINPRDNATRAEIAAILHRFIESNK